MRKSYLLVGVLVVLLAFAMFSHTKDPEHTVAAAPPGPAPTTAVTTHDSPAPTHKATPTTPAAPASTSSTDAIEPFTPKKLAPGQRPPQFIVFSFDGAGWHEKWQYWNDVARRAPMRFTGFLTGLYLLDEQHRDAYQGPGHSPGQTSLGSWNSAAEVVQEVEDLNTAWRNGDEIGTHFNGHFCSDNPPGANDWTTADWNRELDQFFEFVHNYRTIDGLPDAPALQFPRPASAPSARPAWKAFRSSCIRRCAGTASRSIPALRDRACPGRGRAPSACGRWACRRSRCTERTIS